MPIFPEHNGVFVRLVSREGVKANPTKIEAMTSWSQPKNLKQSREVFVRFVLPSFRRALCSNSFSTHWVTKEG